MNQISKFFTLSSAPGELDLLTGLPNRQAFNRIVGSLLQEEHDGKQRAALLIDIDNLKMINCNFGYDAGDLFIALFADFLIESLGDRYYLFHMNSDAFMVVSPHTLEEDAVTTDIDTMLRRFQLPWDMGCESLYCTASLSLVYFPSFGKDLTELTANLYIANFMAKQGGKNKAVMYQQDMQHVAQTLLKRYQTEEMLRDAVKESCRGFELYYQPIYRAQTNKAEGAEALLRFRRRDGIVLMPDSFIELAEMTELIIPIGEYIIRQSAAFCKSMLDRGFADFFVSINISFCQLQKPGFVLMVLDILREAGVPNKNIVLEITERAAISNIDLIMNSCQELRDQGIRIALDDFGTGYSTLSLLHSLPVDIIKIAYSMASDLTNTPVFVRLMSQFAQALNLMLVVEGVEEGEQLRAVKALGNCYVQGYYYHPALPAGDFAAIMDKEGQKPCSRE